MCEDVKMRLIEHFIGITQKDTASKRVSIYDADYYDDSSKVATLFFFDGCVSKLEQCARVKESNFFDAASTQLDIYIFDFQKEYVEKVFEKAPNTNIKAFTFEEIMAIISDNAQKE